jgi:hypothetical protein
MHSKISAVKESSQPAAEAKSATGGYLSIEPDLVSIRRKCAECENEDEVIQRKGYSSLVPFIQSKAQDSISQKIESVRGNGTNMDSQTKSFMESRFESNFLDVNIHTGDYAIQLAKDLNAKAFTTGKDIFFNSGNYNPGTETGKHLLAHELTHVIQQGGQSQYIQRSVDETKTIECPIVDEGIVSRVSWGETSGIYPSENDKYDPSKWDKGILCQLLTCRSAVHEVAKRGETVHKALPGSGKVEQMLKKYHFVENFPSADPEIADAEVKWFYLSNKASLSIHPTMRTLVSVKSYGPFYNNGGGDVPKGTVYIHFYKKK